MKRSRLLMCAAVLAGVACQDRHSLTSPRVPLSAELRDALHGSIRNPHFYLLPPVVPPATITQAFNRGLSPVVRITQMASLTDLNATCLAGPVPGAFFTTTSGPDMRVVMDASNKHYGIVWKTKNFPSVHAPCVYRVAVELNSTETAPGIPLGFADVEIVDNGKAFKNAAFLSNDAVPLLDDGSLPFKFFIGYGAAVYSATNGAVDACRPDRDCGEAIVTAGQNTTILTAQQLAGVFIPGEATSGRGDIAVAIEQRTHPGEPTCISTANMVLPQFDDCYRYVAFPIGSSDATFTSTNDEVNPPTYSFNEGHPVTVGMCVEIGGVTPTPPLQIFRFETDHPNDPAVALPPTSAAFLPCDPFFQPGSSGGLTGVLRKGWQSVVGRVRALIGPRPLYASTSVIHLGLGGSTCCFSYFTWGIPAEMTPNGSTTFTAPVGGSIAPGPSVMLRTNGPDVTTKEPQPVPGVTVTFSTQDGYLNGVPGTTTVAVATDANGIAQVGSWTLPGTDGTYHLTASAPGATPREGIAFTATVVPAEQITFHSTRDGNFEIYVMRPDGSGQTRLTANSVTDFGPDFSREGSKIAFSRDVGDLAEIYVTNPDGTGLTRLTNNSFHDAGPSWSPNGSKLAFRSTRDGNFEIYSMNADGTAQTRLTNSGASDFDSDWSPDGAKIAFTSNRTEVFEVYVMNADGSGVTQLTSDAFESTNPAWSPDGAKIAFTSFRNANSDVYVINADGTGEVRLTTDAAFDGEPTWSPDGTRLAFTSARDGNFEIYVMNADGSGQTRLTFNTALDREPSWGGIPPPIVR